MQAEEKAIGMFVTIFVLWAPMVGAAAVAIHGRFLPLRMACGLFAILIFAMTLSAFLGPVSDKPY